ncbi:MAG: hypothetical protein Q7R43_01150 [Candidatus Daviesbacteria bacterium]|nr:hypothetical protein [Candidatus Daviesbacteria bacterium]
MKIYNLLLIISIVFIIILGFFYQRQALSFHFVDEEDNIVLGSYLFKGEKLYSDLFSQHQPLAYIGSAGITKVTDPNTLFLLIKRHREAVIAWSIFWAVILIIRFRVVMVLSLLIYEPMKIFLLGNLFLSESLVVYPFTYLLGWIFLADKKIYKWEIFFLGICVALSFLLLSPLWPVLFVLTFLIIKKLGKLGRLGWLGFLGGLLVPIILTLNFISIPDYFFNAFYINFKYYIPMTSKGPLWETLFKAFFAPIISLTLWEGRSATLQVIQLLSVILLINSFILWKIKKYNLIILIFIILGLTNLRYIVPGQQSYSGFHILPWFIALILATMVTVKFAWEKYHQVWWKIFLFILIISLSVTIFRESSILLKSTDLNKDFYINYSRQADIGSAVKIMKDNNDSLFVVPDDWLIYYAADIPHFSKMVNYYAWMSDVPEIKQPLHQKFESNLPTFFYCDRCQFGYFGLEKYFGNYKYLKKDGKYTSLMVLKNKLKNLTESQINELKYYNFTLD